MINEVTVKSELLDSFKPFVFKSTKHTVISYLDYPDNPTFIQRKSNELHLFDIGNAWGNGAHPTTKLCIDFLEDGNVSCKDSLLLDYGTGSGILSIVAANLGAKKCISVDIDESSLEAAATNAKLNGFDNVIEVLHTRDVIVGDGSLPLADFTIANIQPGPLSRLVAPLWLLTKPGGYLCLSGMRPHELADIRRIYQPFVQLDTESVQEAGHEIYGQWISWRVRTKLLSNEEKKQCIALLTELSVS